MSDFHLAIIGGGPRALTILERLLEHKARMPREATLDVILVDPGTPGEGAHPTDQANHLLINTLASQTSMYPPQSAIGEGKEVSLLDWAAAQGYQRFSDGYRRSESSNGQTLKEGDHLPRTLLGEFLAAFGREIITSLPENVRVHHVKARAVDIVPKGLGYDVVLDDGRTQTASHVVLAMGHGYRQQTADDQRLSAFVETARAENPRLAHFTSPYPISQLESIADSARVGIQGLGLTAHDVVSALTIGRGGSYHTENGKLVYVPSGREPRLWICSRNTLPFAARGINQKGRTGHHTCRFFTPQAVAEIRATAIENGDARIDFETDLLPLVIKEMAYAYRVAESGRDIDIQQFEPTAKELSAIRHILWPLEGKTFASSAEFRAYFLWLMREDLNEAYRGNCTSGVKAATDALRDGREGFRVAVEFAGLTPLSHRYYLEQFNPIVNRISFGPPLCRNEEWFALFDAGILNVAGGPNTRIETPDNGNAFEIVSDYLDHSERVAVDTVVSARLDNYSPLTNSSPLSANLTQRGLVRPFTNGDYHPCGIDIDDDLHPKDAQGKAQPRLWAVGFVVEGPHFYTHALPRSGMLSRQTIDAERIVFSLYADLAALMEAQTGKDGNDGALLVREVA